jgi:hypothetical protein
MANKISVLKCQILKLDFVNVRLPQAKRMENNQTHRSGKRIPTASNQLSENTTGETGRNS